MEQSQTTQPPQQTSGLAIASLVLGILSCTILGFVAGIPAILCGHSARRKAGGGGLAVAGLVLGYVGTVLSAILFLILVGSLSDSVSRGRLTSVQSELQVFSTQLQLYESLNNIYPTTEQGLRALVQQPMTDPVPSRWYQLLSEVPKDPWGHDYIYRCPGQTGDYRSYDLFSAGPDGVPDTADDIRRF
jgi:general secretion pathway protein G